MKKIFLRISCLVLLFVFAFSTASIANAASSTKYTSGYYTYTVANGKAEICDFDDTEGGNITIPSTLGGYPVTSIGNFAFYLCRNITGVVIPDSVKSIGRVAFTGCTNLSNIKIPDGIISIGNSAFEECSNLVSITLPSGLTTISDNTFAECSSLTTIKIPNGVTVIGNSAFSECSSLVSVAFPDDLISIGESAFYKCSALTSVSMPDGVTTIGESAFNQCMKLSKVTLNDGLLNIGNSAFSWCSSLRSLTIPNSVLSLGDYALHNCDSLTDMVIPDNLTSISRFTFGSCDNLKSIIISKSITSIGESAFFVCNSLTDVYYTGTPDEWKKISIDSNNDPLLNATIHYNYNPSHTHSYISSVTTAATCTKSGVKTYTCECGDSYTETIPSTGHTSGDWLIVYEATAEKEGKKIQKCTVCSETIAEVTIPKLGNTTENKPIVKKPSQTTIRYGDSIILHANTADIPAGATIKWTSNNNNFDMNVSSDGYSCEITPNSSGTTTFTVSVIDSDGNILSTDEQTMTSKAGFFDKIIAFFKGIFGLNKTYAE